MNRDPHPEGGEYFHVESNVRTILASEADQKREIGLPRGPLDFRIGQCATAVVGGRDLDRQGHPQDPEGAAQHAHSRATC